MRALWLFVVGCGASSAAPDAPPPLPLPAPSSHHDFTGAALGDGTCTVCPAVGPGIRGDGLVFSGTEQVVLPGALVGVAPYTVSVWLRPEQTTQLAAPVSKALAPETANTDVFMLLLFGGGLIEYETVRNQLGEKLGPTIGQVLTDGAWHHVAATWDGATKRLYVDGQIDAVVPAELTDSAEPLYLGVDHDNGAAVFPYRGSLDELDVYDRALPAEDLARLAMP